MSTYKENENYIFVSYAHKDRSKVLPIINKMQRMGFRVWYDTGIEAGTEWPTYIEDNLNRSAVVVAFISHFAVESINCRNEINYALMKQKEMLVIYLENTELKYGLGLQLNSVQSLYLYHHASERGFLDELLNAEILQECKMNAGGDTNVNPYIDTKANLKTKAKTKANPPGFVSVSDEVIHKKEEKGSSGVGKTIRLVWLIVCFGLLIGVLLNAFKVKQNQMLEEKYNQAVLYVKEGDYAGALEIFESLGNYKDSFERLTDMKEILKLERAKDYEVGEIVEFGTYYQNGDEKEAIKWQVLDVIDGKALLISQHALDSRQYYTDTSEVTWETSEIRNWLNHDFLNSAFSKQEQAQILTVKVSDEESNSGRLTQGNPTWDQIFLLSVPEAKKYFGSDAERKCQPTEYALSEGAYVDHGTGNCWWWLRTIGSGSYHTYYKAAFVSMDGIIIEDGERVDSGGRAIRPALWLDLTK